MKHTMSLCDQRTADRPAPAQRHRTHSACLFTPRRSWGLCAEVHGNMYGANSAKMAQQHKSETYGEQKNRDTTANGSIQKESHVKLPHAPPNASLLVLVRVHFPSLLAHTLRPHISW